MLLISFIFMPLFLYGGSLVLQPEEDLEYLTVNSNFT